MRTLLASAATLYQALVRPVMPRCCRFHPSCSDYFKEAVLERGVLSGLWLSARRVGRCHPFSPGGFDPVPRHG